MKSLRLVKNGATVVAAVEVAERLADRLRGLLGRPGLPAGTGLLIRPCSSIHTWFMRFPIDVVFLDREGRVVRVERGVRPWRMVVGGRRACSVLEVGSGWLAAAALGIGDAVALASADEAREATTAPRTEGRRNVAM